jgi:hypothetical protein
VKTLLILLLTCGWAVGARAEITTNATYDELFYAATRYGNTEARRAEKEAARTELFRRGADSLREAMERMHFENVMLQVLAMEMVHDQIPATTGRPVLLDYIDTSGWKPGGPPSIFWASIPPRKDPRVCSRPWMTKKPATRPCAPSASGRWIAPALNCVVC